MTENLSGCLGDRARLGDITGIPRIVSSQRIHVGIKFTLSEKGLHSKGHVIR